MDQDNIPVEGVDETELDKELTDSLNSIRAEKGVAIKVEPKEAKVEETPASLDAQESPSPAPAEAAPAAEAPKTDEAASEGTVDVFKAPTKGKFESEEAFAIRVNLSELIKQRKAAKTDDERQALSGKITETRRDLRNVGNNSGKITPQANSDAAPDDGTNQEPATPTPASVEDVHAIVAKEKFDTSVTNTLNEFVARHPELQDEDVREEFFGFVDSNYNWANKTGKELMTVLELARENVFKPSESVQERVLKGANVAEKVGAMTFPGGAVVRPGLTAEQKQSVSEMMATGMSEEKALALISD